MSAVFILATRGVHEAIVITPSEDGSVPTYSSQGDAMFDCDQMNRDTDGGYFVCEVRPVTERVREFREPARAGCPSCGRIKHVDRSCDCGGAP